METLVLTEDATHDRRLIAYLNNLPMARYWISLAEFGKQTVTFTPLEPTTAEAIEDARATIGAFDQAHTMNKVREHAEKIAQMILG